MKHEQPDIYQNTAMFADIKTYIFYQLYGEYVIDHLWLQQQVCLTYSN